MAPTRDAFFLLWQTSQKHRTIYRRRCVSPVKKHGFQHKKIENPKNPWDDDFCFLRDWGVFFEKRREKREEKRKVRRQERTERREEKREDPPPAARPPKDIYIYIFIYIYIYI